ncbi:glycosyltransferase [uncultured Bilophila sp.]|uniref:glycosyltransferase n=1 Tax=uncultured Bilophila sp. TaxID=529385 RepID=UPI0026DC0730|nr:glycosyltransferase [uncultured Bilophila sp.]
MRVLFLHYAFPGPFRHLAEHLAAMPDVSVTFASEYGRRDLSLPGVRRVVLGTPKAGKRPEPPSPLKAAEYDLCMAYRRGVQTARALLTLREKGFVPDMICTTAVMGNAFALRDVFPESFLVVYAEAYARRSPESPATLRRASERIRNLLQLNGLADCDLAVTSTEWQRSRFPEWLSRNMLVLHKCVDTDFFSPESGGKKAGEELVTFSGRGLETSLGLPRLFESLSALFAVRPSCRAVILASGVEQTRLPELRKRLLAELGDDAGRVNLCGFSVPELYRLLLRASSLHVYLTTPSMLSLGLFESMSCGCLVLASDTEPVREVVREGKNGFLCGFHSPEDTAGRIAGLLARAPALAPVREAARKTVVELYSLGRTMRENWERLLGGYEHWRRLADHTERTGTSNP